MLCFYRKSQSVSLSNNNEGTPDSKHQKYSSYDSYSESSRYKNHDRRWKEGFVLMFVSLFEPDCQQLPGDKVSPHWDNDPRMAVRAIFYTFWKEFNVVKYDK